MRPPPKDPYRLFEVKPAISGALVTRGSADNAGIFNYVAKQDFRRDLDVEKRREGYDYFHPRQTAPDIGGDPFPSQIQIDTLVRSGNTVTAARTMGHWFENGESIIISGAANGAYNGTFTIFNVTATTFQYTVTGSPPAETSPAIYASANETLNLLGYFERPNGQLAVIAGSPTRLYRYLALDDPDYISSDPADYPPGTAADQLGYWSDGTEFPADSSAYPAGTPVSQQQYVDTQLGYWIVIGAGFDPNGNRWEAVPINGWMVFNNARDLPVTYRVEEQWTEPIWELRDQGVASVGTIAELDGILMCGDISEIHSDVFVDWMRDNHHTHIDHITSASGIATATVDDVTLIPIPFHAGDNVTIHQAIHPQYNGTFQVLSATSNSFTYRVNGAPVSPDGSGGIYATGDPYQKYDDINRVDRTQYRIIWATPDFPRNWAAQIPGFMTAGSNQLLLQYPAKSFQIGDKLTIVGAGAPEPGGTAQNLEAKVIFINDRTLIVDQFAQTTVSLAPVIRTDDLGSIVGQSDLQDDGSAILKMLALADQMVIYKATSIFLGQYLGNPAQPFAFTIRQVQQTQALFYRHTVALVKTSTEMFHIYAGAVSFCRFDLSSQQPMLLPHFESCSDVFYKQATLANQEKIFVCANDLTSELWFILPFTTAYGPERGLLWDYKQDTIATTGFIITAGATVTKPIAGLQHGPQEKWFILGIPGGTVAQYGLGAIDQPQWNNAKAIYYFRGANPYSPVRNPYPSNIQCGLGNFGSDYLEKDLRAIVPLMDSKSPDTAFTLSVYSAHNANSIPALAGSVLLSDPVNQNLVPMYFRELYFAMGISLTGIDNPLSLVGVAWDVSPVISRSATRG